MLEQTGRNARCLRSLDSHRYAADDEPRLLHPGCILSEYISCFLPYP